jgi:uncharacterized membrane protein
VNGLHDVARASGAHRALSLVAALGLFWPTFQAWNDIVSVPASGIATVALFGATLFLVCAIATASTEAALERLDRWLLALGLLVLGAWGASSLHLTSGYSTDEAGFVQGAANLLLHGHDPYGANLIPALSQYAVPAQFWTYTMNGGVVSTLGYPALPVLIAVPFVELTGGGQAVPIANLAVLMIATIAMFCALPRGLRPIAIVVCVGFPALTGFGLAGDNAILMMAALLVVAYRWRTIGISGALTRGDQLRAIAFGLALSTNQLAWFLAPFLLTGIFLARREHLGSRRAAKVLAVYFGVAAATFLLINAPFIAWGPLAWVKAVAAPLTQHALPYGQGVVGLTLFLHVGGGAIDAYSYAAGLLFVALLVVYAMEFRKLGRCCFVFPAIALYASGRSLAGYWMVLVAVIVLSVVTSDDRDATESRMFDFRSRPSGVARRVVMTALFAPAAIFLVVALTTPAPLSMHILSATSDPQARGVRELRVDVRNGSDTPLRPHFATNSKGQASPYWTVSRGPSTLAPGTRATYVLSMADTALMPPNATPFVLQAVTGAPRTISSSQVFVQPGPAPQSW